MPLRPLVLLLLLHTVHANVSLTCVFLLEMSAFTARGLSARFEALLTSNFGPSTLQSIQSVSLTGAEVRQLYFPQNTDIRLFSVVHLTRVVASLQTNDDTNTTKYVAQFLAPLCADLAPVAIDRVGQPSLSPFDAFLQMFPPTLGFVMALLWVVTMATCGVCWGCWCFSCCKKGGKKATPPPKPKPSPPPTEPTTPAPSAPPMELLQPTPTTLRRQLADPFSAPPQPFFLRLPEELQSGDRADPYAAPPSRAGPAAVRLASWHVDPPPPPT